MSPAALKKRFWLMWTVALVATVPSASAGILAQVVPSKYNLTVRESEPISRDVAIHNLGDAPVVVKVRLSDWTMDEAGNMSFAEPGKTPATLQGSIEFEPKQFSLGPGETGVVHVSMHLPAQGPATRYGVLLSEVRPTTWPKNHFGPRAIAEIGTTLYLSRIPADLTHAQLIGLDTRAASDTSLSVAFQVRNPGERHLYATGEIALRDSTGAVVAQGSVGTGVVLPRAYRTFTWTCSNRLAPGFYAVTATLDTGEPELIVGETRMRWPILTSAPLPVAAGDDR